MRHPFDGINQPDVAPRLSQSSLMRLVLAGGAAVVGLWVGQVAHAAGTGNMVPGNAVAVAGQGGAMAPIKPVAPNPAAGVLHVPAQPPVVSTTVVGEEGGPLRPVAPPVQVTTDIWGEEGGGTLTILPVNPIGTSLVVGEEGGGTLHPVNPPGTVTTDIAGEEGGIGTLTINPPITVTSFVVGEEGGFVTTQAIGEEGGGTGIGTLTIHPITSIPPISPPAQKSTIILGGNGSTVVHPTLVPVPSRPSPATGAHSTSDDWRPADGFILALLHTH